MSDWIDERAASEKKKKAEELTEAEISQQKATVVKERFPTFWEALLKQVYSDCSELKMKLPDSTYDHFHVGSDHIGGFTLTCDAVPPLRQITVRPDPDSLRIHVLGTASTAIIVAAAEDGLLSFAWRGKTFAGEVDLSLALIEYCKTGQFHS